MGRLPNRWRQTMLRVFILIISLILLTSCAYANYELLDEGTSQGFPYKLDCVGGGVSCLRTGTTGTINITGGGVAEVYGAGWDASVEAPTKNDVYDKIETLSATGGGTTDAGTVVHTTTATDDLCIGDTVQAGCPLFADESAETFLAQQGFVVGDNTAQDVTIMLINLPTDQSISWDDTNQEFDFSAPINASGTGQSVLGQGLIVNNSSSGTEDEDFIVKTDTLTAIEIDAGDDTATMLGTWDFGGSVMEVPSTTVSGLPAATLGRLALVTDGNADSDCTTGSGAIEVLCMANGTSWEATGDSGAGGGGDSIQIDSSAVVDPDFVSTGDIDFVDTSNTITANINALAIVTGDIAADTITHTNIADADQADTKCIWFEDPVAADDFNSIWANKTANDFLITEIWCESDQTVNMDLQVDDGTPADVNGSDLACTSSEAEDTSLSGDTTVAAGEELDLAITSVSGTPTWVSICFTGNWVD